MIYSMRMAMSLKKHPKIEENTILLLFYYIIKLEYLAS